jgi:hypothetical protein
VAFADLIPDRFRAPALSAVELERAQAESGVRFPPDLCELLAVTLPTGPQFPDWRARPRESLQSFRDRITEGIVFDALHNSVWLGSWGERPSEEPTIRALLAEQVRDAPALIPIYAHRGIPNEPLAAGNPVFSVMQTDVIIYGSDLRDYLQHEFGGAPSSAPSGQVRRIRFWTELLDAWD